MSRQNKVNPGTYTQRGRLTQDDAARELRKQSVIASPSRHTSHALNTKTGPRMAPAGDAPRDTERSADNETMVEPEVETRPASGVTRNMTATEVAPSNAKARIAKAKTATTRKSKRTTGKAKTGKATAIRRTTKPMQKAVRARNIGGGGAAGRPTTKRQKSRAIRRRQE